MPSRKDDRFFGGKQGASQKALDGMRRHYKDEKTAQRVFHATMATRKRESGLDSMKAPPKDKPKGRRRARRLRRARHA